MRDFSHALRTVVAKRAQVVLPPYLWDQTSNLAPIDGAGAAVLRASASFDVC